MKRTTILLGACSVLGAVSVGCGSSGDDENTAPAISELTVDRDAMVVGSGTALATVVATDPDGDPLQYAWTVTVGTVDPSVGPGQARLIAPADRGTATVTVTVTDGRGGSAEKSVDVGVYGFVAPSSVGNVPAGYAFNAVSFANADDGVVVGGSDTNVADNVPYIFHYKAGTWTDETKGTAGHLTTTAALAPDNIWAVGGGGLAFHYDGAAWKQLTVPGGCVHGIDYLSPSNIWATPAEGQAYMRQYTGGTLTTWTQFPAPSSSGMGGVSMVSETDGWAVGNGGMAIRFNGTDWQKQTVPVTKALKTVDMIASDDGWIVGASGTVMHWDGTSWTLVTTPAGTTQVNGVFALASDDVWAVGNSGLIMHYDGSVWSLVPSPVASDLQAVHFTSTGNGWIAGFDSTILHFE
jgi:hypothetical protein